MTTLNNLVFVSLLTILIIKPYVGKSQELSRNAIDSAIHKMAKLIEENYVFVEKGKKIASHLMQEHRNGRFSGSSTWKDFASLTTRSLQDFSHDGHVYVGNDPAVVRKLINPNQVSNEDSPAWESAEVNYGFKEIKILDGNIGYIRITKINTSEKGVPVLFAAMQLVANTRALIIDLRDNGGGGGDTGPVFESIFLPKNTPLLEFKTRDGKSSVDKTLEWLPVSKYEQPLYMVVNPGTASAAEYYAYALQLRKRAKIVGQRSAGAANMNTWYPVNDRIYLSVSTASPTIPGTEESWERKGVQPDYVVEKGQEIDAIVKLLSGK